MNEFKEALNIVYSEDELNEMLKRLYIAAALIGTLILMFIVYIVWKNVAGGKVKKAILSLSEYPDDKHAEQFLRTVSHISPVGRFFTKHDGGFAGISKSECRNIYNTTVLNSKKMNTENKESVRSALMKLGFNGLTSM